MKRKFTLIILILSLFIIIKGNAQSIYQPYSYDFNQKLNAEYFSLGNRFHTSIKPTFENDSILLKRYQRILTFDNDQVSNKRYGKFFNEHLISIKKSHSDFYADLLPEAQLGREFSKNAKVYSLSAGLQIGGSIGDKVHYYLAGYVNSSEMPSYLSTYVQQVGIVPGMAHADNHNNGNTYSWNYISGSASYTASKYLTLSAGRDKTFIGDGYRSLLLSDFASPYPFLKLTATLGNVRYLAMWASFTDPALTSDLGIKRNKWGVFHYLDWNVNNRLSFGFFDSVIWSGTDDAGHARGFDFTYINPVIFLRPLEASNGSPDNAMIGFTSKYKLTNGVIAYGQFALDEFQAKEFFTNQGSARNKFGYQLGVRGANLLGVENLNYLMEVNTVRPYTYSERSSVINYSANSEPLAHPWGANFRELVALLNYSYKRFQFMTEADFGRYGLDINGNNFGKDIFRHYTTPAFAENNVIGQGLKTNLIYLQSKIGFIVNPKYNLRLELGGIYRNEKNADFNENTTLVTIGVKSSFQQIYTDLASYKTHL